MSNSVNFKFGSTREGKEIAANDLVAINAGIAKGGNSNYGSIYKGDKILGTTEADKLYTTEDITIAGGPMESLLTKVFTDGKIPAGTSLHDFFKLMACTDTYPSTSSVEGTFSTSISAPSVTGSKSSGSVMEIGSTVTINKITANATSVSATDAVVSGMTYGYKSTKDGETNVDTSISKSWSYNANANDEYTLSASVTSGFTGLTNSSASNAEAASCSLNSQSLIVGLGNNTLKVTATGVGYTGSVNGISSVYVVSNIGSVSDDKKTVALDAKTNISSTPESKYSEYKITGVYPVFTNIVDGALTAAVDTKKVTNASSFEYDFPKENANRVSFAYPAGRTVTVQVYNTMSKAYENYSGAYTDVAESTKRNINGNEVQYNVWTRVDENANDAVKYKFVLSKSTNA